MKTKLSPVFVSILILLLASLACQALDVGAPVDVDLPATAPAASDDAAPAANSPPAADSFAPVSPAVRLPDPIQPQGAGMACFGLRAGGLTCLDENGWQTFTRENSGLPSNFLQAADVCSDGRILIAHSDGLSLFDGVNWETVPKSSDYSTADAVACAPDGRLWVAHFKGVSVYFDGAWTLYPAELLATGESANQLVYGIAASPDGRVWAVTSRSVAVFENDEWQVFQEGQGFDESVFFNAVTIDSLDRPWAGLSKGAAYYDGKWTMVAKPGYGSPSGMAFDASGRLWLGASIGGLSMFNGNTWVDFNRKLGTLPSDKVRGLAADSLGRVWAATTYGMVVFDGDTRETYRMENSDIGDNELRFVVVVKDGPLIPAVDERETGSMTGKLERANGTAMAGKRVEICVESLPRDFSEDTPCTGQPFLMSTTTDENGAFFFENLPAGYYVFAAETDDGWAQLTTQFGIGSERTPILPGEDYDIGTLTLEED
jgi:ligand-binding sensor domain-containing protein